MKTILRKSMSTHARMLARSILAMSALLAFAVPLTTSAQETTTAVRGNVTAPDGSAVAGASVSITDTRTGVRRATTTNDVGSFVLRGLPVGGPYNLRVESGQYQDALVTDVFTNLSSVTSFDIALGADAAIEEIVVTASQVATMDLAIGPGTAFSLQDIEQMPSIARQIRDVVRVDPRVSLGRQDNGGGSGINCLGGAPRSNAFTIDGSLAIDGFGLNEGTGTSARFAFPIPFDTVASASVEFAPLDVQYSQFTGCAINVVTKPGENEFHGSVFYLWNDDSLTGDTIDGATVISDPFEDENYGVNISGPIIKDKLWFFAAYEETDEGGVQNTGPIGAGFANEEDITLADAELIAGILQSQYGRDVGGIVRTLPQTSERTFLRLDWNINDEHRAELTYTQLDELNLDPDDLGFGGFTFRDNFENEGIEQDTISLRVFSDWTDNFSTEFRYSFFDVVDIQGPAGGGEAQDEDIPRIEVEDGAGSTILTSGPGFFRSANDLKYDIEQIKLSADYILGDHTLTFGYERETRDIFNLFIPDATGTITFDSIADLQAGTASGIVMNGSFTQDPTDAAAAFERSINSFYLQDEWRVNDAVTLIAGLRLDDYESDDRPLPNPAFVARYGFGNQQTFDGLELLQPRVGVTWDLPYDTFGETQLTAGFGVFGGGDPTVHFANAYQNFGGAIGFGGHFSAACGGDPAVLQVINGGQFTGIPQCVRQAAADAANANNGAVAAVDPDFDLPSNHRWSLGVSHTTDLGIEFFNNWEIRADYIYTEHKDAVDWVDLRLSPDGATLPDGRPQFVEIDPLQAGCNATFNGLRQGFSGVTPECLTGGDNQDVLMTNGVEGSTKSFTIQFAKSFDFTDRTSLDLNLGYAWLDAETGNPVNSSTATSSYEEVAVVQPNLVGLGPALWANEHNIVLRASLQHYFWDDNPTTFSLFFQRRSGRPFSYAYEDDTVEEYFGDSDDESRILVYVPTGPSDPLFDFSNLDPQEVTELFALLDQTGLSRFAGQIAPKNAFNSPWTTDLDIRISQDIPLWNDHSLQVFVDIENALNLIFGDDENVFQYADTDDVQEAVRIFEIAEFIPDAINNFDQFEITRFYNDGASFNQDVDDSVYRIQLGVRYSF